MNRILILVTTISCVCAFNSSAPGQTRMLIRRMTPARVYVMDRFDLIGSDFGDHKPKTLMVVMKLNDDGRRWSHKPRILKWSHRLIELETPESAVPGHYTIGIYLGRESNLISNEMNLTVLGGIMIQSIKPNPASPGDTIEILGVHFGSNQVARWVSINRNGTTTRLPILNWSEERIRAQVPESVDVGNYVLLIYYDEGIDSGSPSVEFTIQRRRD